MFAHIIYFSCQLPRLPLCTLKTRINAAQFTFLQRFNLPFNTIAIVHIIEIEKPLASLARTQKRAARKRVNDNRRAIAILICFDWHTLMAFKRENNNNRQRRHTKFSESKQTKNGSRKIHCAAKRKQVNTSVALIYCVPSWKRSFVLAVVVVVVMHCLFFMPASFIMPER